MFWEFFLAVLTFIQIPGEDSPPNPVSPVQLDPINGQIHGLISSDFMLYNSKNRKDVGPQTPQERALARKALHRPHKGGDMRFRKRSLHAEGTPLVSNTALFTAVSNESLRWKGYPGKGKIPYVFDRSIDEKFRSLIKRGMDQYNKLTCVKFTPRLFEKDYVRIFNGKDDGCWSYVGRVGGLQELSLGYGCNYIGTVVHELGHALGLLHEHQRHDRDNFITVHEHNIIAGLEDQFERTPRDAEIIFNNFDYNSIMIYGNYAFSRDVDNLMTMEALNGVRLIEPYDKPGLDNSDIQRVRELYRCR